MGITATDAVEIARRHGLSLVDASALHRLADNRAEAEEIAREYAPEPDRDLTLKAIPR
jgi:hypothetical protein